MSDSFTSELLASQQRRIASLHAQTEAFAPTAALIAALDSRLAKSLSADRRVTTEDLNAALIRLHATFNAESTECRLIQLDAHVCNATNEDDSCFRPPKVNSLSPGRESLLQFILACIDQSSRSVEADSNQHTNDNHTQLTTTHATSSSTAAACSSTTAAAATSSSSSINEVNGAAKLTAVASATSATPITSDIIADILRGIIENIRVNGSTFGEDEKSYPMHQMMRFDYDRPLIRSITPLIIELIEAIFLASKSPKMERRLPVTSLSTLDALREPPIGSHDLPSAMLVHLFESQLARTIIRTDALLPMVRFLRSYGARTCFQRMKNGSPTDVFDYAAPNGERNAYLTYDSLHFVLTWLLDEPDLTDITFNTPTRLRTLGSRIRTPDVLAHGLRSNEFFKFNRTAQIMVQLLEQIAKTREDMKARMKVTNCAIAPIDRVKHWRATRMWMQDTLASMPELLCAARLRDGLSIESDQQRCSSADMQHHDACVTRLLEILESGSNTDFARYSGDRDDRASAQGITLLTAILRLPTRQLLRLAPYRSQLSALIQSMDIHILIGPESDRSIHYSRSTLIYTPLELIFTRIACAASQGTVFTGGERRCGGDGFRQTKEPNGDEVHLLVHMVDAMTCALCNGIVEGRIKFEQKRIGGPQGLWQSLCTLLRTPSFVGIVPPLLALLARFDHARLDASCFGVEDDDEDGDDVTVFNPAASLGMDPSTRHDFFVAMMHDRQAAEYIDGWFSCADGVDDDGARVDVSLAHFWPEGRPAEHAGRSLLESAYAMRSANGVRSASCIKRLEREAKIWQTKHLPRIRDDLSVHIINDLANIVLSYTCRVDKSGSIPPKPKVDAAEYRIQPPS